MRRPALAAEDRLGAGARRLFFGDHLTRAGDLRLELGDVLVERLDRHQSELLGPGFLGARRQIVFFHHRPSPGSLHAQYKGAPGFRVGWNIRLCQRAGAGAE